MTNIGDSMRTDIGLAGRRALVTGAGQGVGAVIARTLASAGAEVLVNDYFADRAEAVAEAIVAEGRSATALAFDVTDHAGARAALSAAGRVDVLVNNAGNAGIEGFGELTPFVATTPDDWAKYLAVNLHGVMNCVHAALPAMIEARWGRIITIVSDAARTGEAQMAAYCAAKAGAAGFGRAIAREVGRHGITGNKNPVGTKRTPGGGAFWGGGTKGEQQGPPQGGG